MLNSPNQNVKMCFTWVFRKAPFDIDLKIKDGLMQEMVTTFISQLNKTNKTNNDKAPTDEMGDFLGNGTREIEICLEVGEGCA